MKVKFLGSGRQAHAESGRGNFEYKKDETMSGLSEATVNNMISSKQAALIGPDDEEESTDGGDENSKSDSNPNSEAGATGEPDGNSGSKPWFKS